MKLEWEVLELEPEHPFRISRSVERRIRRVWVRISADGVEGWGEADPSEYYGEDADTVVAALEAMRPAVEAASDPEMLEPLERELARRVEGVPQAAPEGGTSAGSTGDPGGGGPALPAARAPHASARAAVTAALYDLVGKRLGRPLWRLWGLDPGAAPVSSFTLGIDEPEVMARKAREARGWPVLKVKLGLEDAREEEAILDAVRSGAPDAVLRVDANAGWTADEAIERIPGLAERGVESVEQPLPPEDREGLRRVREASSLPVVLDESCVVAADVPGLAGLCHGVNVKLAKCGGPREALRAVHAARACGLKVMLGCMLETSLGIAPAAHLSPLVDWVDLDGAALLREDPFEGPGPVPPGAAGDGVTTAPDGGDGPKAPAPDAATESGEDRPGDRAPEPGRIRLTDAPGLGVARRGD